LRVIRKYAIDFVMMRTILKSKYIALAVAAMAIVGCQPAEPHVGGKGEINIYSARHYDADEQLYSLFEQQTGIAINRIEMKGDLLLERLKAEGDQSPADVILLVDAGNFYRAGQAGLFQAVTSPTLNTAIPKALHGEGDTWFGFAKRARIIAYDKAKVTPAQVATYEGLADPSLRGKICVRPSSNIYNLSLMASFIDMWGVPRAEAWAKGVVANFARAPEGADTDQIKAIAEGKCAVAIVNHYYAIRMQRSADPAEKAAGLAVTLSSPNQATTGTHVNVSGGALAAHSPNKANAIAFLEFLASPAAQTIFAKANDEFPAVAGTTTDNPELTAVEGFKEAATSMAALGNNQAEAQKVYDRAGWK
jgi:iron(III) transport system substrate-binding protein